MKDVPTHWHRITSMTAAWQDYVAAVHKVATDTAATRARRGREQQHREVHVTKRPHSEKGGQ